MKEFLRRHKAFVAGVLAAVGVIALAVKNYKHDRDIQRGMF